MVNRELVSKGLQFLEEKGWSDLIDGRWEDEVKKCLLAEFPDMNEDTVNDILDVVIL